MDIYKKRVTRKGETHFFKNGKAVDIAEVPYKAMMAEAGVEVEIDPNEPDAVPYDGHVSVLSGEPATRRKFLNNTVYWITEEEYQKYNLGKLAQAIRERQTLADDPK